MLGNIPGGRSQDHVLDNRDIAALRDPRRLAQLKNMSLGQGSLYLCEVHDVLAYANSYIVKAAGMPKMPACLLSATSSFLPLGGRDCATIMPGSLVLCFIDSNMPLACIVGVLPTVMGGTGFGLPDSIVAAGHAGLFVDSAHNGVLQQKSAHGFLDLSAGRPVDSLPGDWGFLNEIGVGVFIGKLMAFLRAGDFCKFEVNYEDQLARIAAMNFEILTSGSEEQAFNDEGEWTSVRGFNSYPWEAAGVSTGDPFKVTEAALGGTNENAGLEPQVVMQTGLWRFRTFDGFLGDIRCNMVMAPVVDLGATPMAYGRTSTPYYGLLKERFGIDGSYVLQSAKSISFQKTCWIPVPFDKMSRDNPNGDTEFTNYAGVDEEDYKMDEIPQTDTGAQAAASLVDKQTYNAQHLSSEGVNLRTKDWGVEDPPKMPGGFDQEMDTLGVYSTYEAAIPASEEAQIDHRGKRTYFKSRSFFELLDDGGISFGDAHGSRITLSGGNIEITCPGNVIMRPGRDAVIMTGRDHIVKANNDIDISSATGSIRQKAELNFMILGGNAGNAGGVLIENRSTSKPNFESVGDTADVGGLNLKSATGALTMWGQSINIQSLVGDINIDAAESTGTVRIYANKFNRYLTTSAEEFILPKGAQATEPKSMSYYSLSASGYDVVANSMRLAGNSLYLLPRSSSNNSGLTITHKGNASIQGRYSATGDFQEAGALDFQPLVKGLEADTNGLRTEIQTDDTDIRQSTTAYLNSAVYTRVGVTFRTSVQLGMSAEFVLYQTDWQRSFKTAGSTETFEESVVKAFVNKSGVATGSDTMPYPGKAAWADQETHFATREDVYRDNTTDGSKPKSRTDETYNEAPVKPVFEFGKLAGSYLINLKMIATESGGEEDAA